MCTNVGRKKRRRNTQVNCSNKALLLCNFPPQPASHLPLQRLPADWWLRGCGGSGTPSGPPTPVPCSLPSTRQIPSLHDGNSIERQSQTRGGRSALPPPPPPLRRRPAPPQLINSQRNFNQVWMKVPACWEKGLGEQSFDFMFAKSEYDRSHLRDNGVQSLRVQGCSERLLQPELLFKAEH